MPDAHRAFKALSVVRITLTAMTDVQNTETSRPAMSYTPSDHARVAMAAATWSVLGSAVDALVPELRHEARPTALIDAARKVHSAAARLMEAAVVASHEQGMTWTQIGSALDVTKQSAHERYADNVTGFRQQLAAWLNALAEAPSAKPRAVSSTPPLLVDTAWYAPRLDAWRAELGEVPGVLAAAGRPGELLAQLSDPATAVTGLNGTTARPIDARPLNCRFTAQLDWTSDSDPGDYLTCTGVEGHPGQHRLAVANSNDY